MEVVELCYLLLSEQRTPLNVMHERLIDSQGACRSATGRWERRWSALA